ncbi:MAG TPA: hypothetical protein VGI16_12565 [Candidatus Acidoferrum sp.]|jgi:hypothetical protein
MTTDFRELYKNRNDDQLLRLAKEKNLLQDAARHALESEIEERGLGDGALVELETQERAQTMRDQELATVYKEERSNWFMGILGSCGIFGASAILAVLTADYLLKPPSDAVRLLTVTSLRIAIVLGLLASGPRWMTIKRTLVSAAIFSISLFGWIFWSAYTRHL